MNVNIQQITSSICEILDKKLKVNTDVLIQENFNLPLTGKKFNIDSLGLTYLFLEVETQFSIKIDANKIMNYEFNTINGVAELIGSF